MAANRLTINGASVPHLNYEYNKALVLNTAQHMPIADAIAPETGKVSRERSAAESWVLKLFYFRKISGDAQGVWLVNCGELFFSPP